MSVALKSICIVGIFLLFVTISGINGDSVTTTTTALPDTALNCSSIVPAENLNFTWLNGTWFEMYRNDLSGAKQDWQCVKLVLTPKNSSMTVQTTYSQKPNLSHTNKITANITWESATPGMFNLTYNASSLPAITLKLIKSDYVNYMMACGYKNVNENAVAYFFTRKPTLSKMAEEIINEAGSEYSDYYPLTSIVQGNSCNGSFGISPTLTIILTLIVSVLKIFS